MYAYPDSAIGLTELGIRQAINAGENLRELQDSGYLNWHWHDVHAFVSGYSRAKQTGRIVLDVMGMRHVELIEARGINERRYGKLIIDGSEEHNQDTNPTWRPGPGGETMLECRDRFAFWYAHHAEYLLTDADVVLFMHGEVLKTAVDHLMDCVRSEMMDIPCPNGVPFIFERDPETKRYSRSPHQFQKLDPQVKDVVR
jgi:broad specificity phosphatase PhoE